MQDRHQILIIKNSGESEYFNPNKLRNSLQRSGANPVQVEQVIDFILKSIQEGDTTREIFQSAHQHLHQLNKGHAGRYKLKEAIYELGPSGFPFEQFIAKILEHEGYMVQINVIVQGKCVSHEIDVVAQIDNKHFMIECKFHSDKSRYCNVKIPLYIQSRFLDVKDSWIKLQGHESKFHQGWVATNTRFSSDALQYGNCAGLYLLSWDTPKDNSLRERVNRSGLHPITCISSLSLEEKAKILESGIVLTQQLCENPNILKKIGISSSRQKVIVEESYDICEAQQ